MKTLLIMRHAKSSWQDAGLADHDRPLNQRGRDAAPRMGRLVDAQQLHPSILLCSTAQRARLTAELVAADCGTSPEVQSVPEFYLAAPETYLATLRQQPDSWQCVMVIGHNPGLEQLLSLLTGAEEAMPTAALAVVQLPIDSWSELALNTPGKLLQLWLPRELE